MNKNHRHDEEHEIRTDKRRAEICENNRFNSYFPMRKGNIVKWFVDGRDYFWAVSIALEQAKESIYITDWWLSPELFLRRPPYSNQEYRLDKLLKRKAEEGVQIYISVYKEVEQALTCNSAHTKHALRRLQESLLNITGQLTREQAVSQRNAWLRKYPHCPSP